MLDDSLDDLHHAKFFTKLFMKLGYPQVHVNEEDTWKTGFNKNQGWYE